MYVLSSNGERFLKNLEGLRLKAYRCAAGKLTIGWGHRIKEGEPISISAAQAEMFFRGDTGLILIELWAEIKTLSQTEVDALVAFIYNIGIGAWRGSTARHFLTNRWGARVPEEMRRWVHDDYGNVIPGLVVRQEKTANLFMGAAA